MSNEPKDGGPAFPKLAGWRPTGNSRMETTAEYDAGGMTIRDWFAGQALSGLLHPGWDANAVNNPAIVATHAYAIADALLAARSLSA